MRDDDFPPTIKKLALKRANNRCERCWTKKDLNFTILLKLDSLEKKP